MAGVCTLQQQVAPRTRVGILRSAEAVHRGAKCAPLRYPSESVCAVPYSAGARNLRIPWLLRAQEALHRVNTASYGQSARTAEDGRRRVPLSVYDGHVAPTDRTATVCAYRTACRIACRRLQDSRQQRVCSTSARRSGYFLQVRRQGSVASACVQFLLP